MKDDRKNKINVPNLRFPGFEGEWEELRLDKVASIERGRFSPRPRNNPIYYDGEIPFVQTSDVVNSNGKIKQYSQTLNEKGLAVSKLFPQGTILITIAANIGYAGILQTDMTCPDSLIGLICKPNTHNEFLNYLLLKEQPKMDYLAVSAAQKNINIDFLKPYKFHFPIVKEQKCISNFLNKIDERIQAQIKIIEEYKLLKNGMMQKIFKQEFRFKNEIGNFYPKWEEKKLGELSTITTGESNRQDSGLDGEYTFFDRSEEIRKSSRFLFDTEAVIVAGEGSDFIPKYFVGKFDLHQRTYAIMSFQKSIGKFIYYYIHFFRNYFLSQAVGSTVKSLRLPMFQKMKIKLPSIAEQQKIASTLSAIDKKIELETGLLDKLKAQKQYCLQNLFI